MRIGIAKKGFFGGIKRPKGERLTKHVLGTFGKGEKEALLDVHASVDNAIKAIVEEGLETAMNRFN